MITILEVRSQKDYKKIENIISRGRKNKFKEELKYYNEIKAYKSSKELKFHLLDKLNKSDVNFHSIILNKKNYKNSFLLQSKKPSNIYKTMILELLSKINRKNKFKLTIDKFLLKRKIKQFNAYIINNLNTSLNTPTTLTHTASTNTNNTDNIKIFHDHSQKIKGLQIADLVAWSTFQYFEKNNPEYIEKLKNHQIFEYTTEK